MNEVPLHDLPIDHSQIVQKPISPGKENSPARVRYRASSSPQSGHGDGDGPPQNITSGVEGSSPIRMDLTMNPRLTSRPSTPEADTGSEKHTRPSDSTQGMIGLSEPPPPTSSSAQDTSAVAKTASTTRKRKSNALSDPPQSDVEQPSGRGQRKRVQTEKGQLIDAKRSQKASKNSQAPVAKRTVAPVKRKNKKN